MTRAYSTLAIPFTAHHDHEKNGESMLKQILKRVSLNVIASPTGIEPDTSPHRPARRFGYHYPLWHPRGMAYEIRQNWPLMLMVLPGLILLFIFSYLPLAGIAMAFQNYRDDLGLFGSPWIGLKNFEFLFSYGGKAWHVTWTTIYMNVLFLITGTCASLFIAILLNEVRDHSKYLAKFYQTALLFPFFISYVIISYFVSSFLDGKSGIVNHLLMAVNITPPDWYSSPEYWPLILTIVNLWKGAGMGSIWYLAGMVSINPEYYEAARLDGANRRQQIWYIMLPLLKPLIVINILLRLAHVLSADFGLFFQVTKNQSSLYPTTEVIDVYVYNALIRLNDFGLSMAAGLYQALVSCVLLITVNFVVRRADKEKSLF